MNLVLINVSSVTWNVSRVSCHVTRVTYHVSRYRDVNIKQSSQISITRLQKSSRPLQDYRGCPTVFFDKIKTEPRSYFVQFVIRQQL